MVIEEVFTISDIKNAAYKALELLNDNELPDYFRGMRLLINTLEAEEQPTAPAEPVKAAPKIETATEPGVFVGYGAKLKRELYNRLLAMR